MLLAPSFPPHSTENQIIQPSVFQTEGQLKDSIQLEAPCSCFKLKQLLQKLSIRSSVVVNEGFKQGFLCKMVPEIKVSGKRETQRTKTDHNHCSFPMG